MTDDQKPAPTSGRSTLADIVAMASHGTVRHQPDGFPVENRDQVVTHDAPAVRREDAGDHVPARDFGTADRQRLVTAANQLRLAESRVRAALQTGRPELLPDAIASAQAALAHLTNVR